MISGHAHGWELAAWLLPAVLAFALCGWRLRPSRLRAVAETQRICHDMAESAMSDVEDQET
jgi:hypothetical protein